MKHSIALEKETAAIVSRQTDVKTDERLISAPKHSDLIYDVGMHKGEDTAYYLKKGFRVVGFEANPQNADYCRSRFSDAISQGKLTIVEGAIIETDFSCEKTKKVKFYRNVNHSPWGSASEDWAERNEVMGTSNEVIEVEATDFKRCLAEYGVPYYLKADIVGSETICLRSLLEFENKPDFISIRSEKFVFGRLEKEFELLERLGYDSFQAIQQDVSQMRAPANSKEGVNVVHSFEEGASGIFGKDLSEKDWKSKEQILKEYRRIFAVYWLFGDYSFLRQSERGRRFISRLERIFRRPLPGWYDTHAKHSSYKFLSGALFYASFVIPQ
ncbi:MAG: FkbM family methyltransferase [Acidobacteriota bacterium]|nr:FkbM family methyltransferase [Acidobacteriota bacterium]